MASEQNPQERLTIDDITSAYLALNGGGGILVNMVEQGEDYYVADKTAKEIFAVIKKGGSVVFRFHVQNQNEEGESYYPLAFYSMNKFGSGEDDYECQFIINNPDDGSIDAVKVIHADVMTQNPVIGNMPVDPE